MNIDPDELAKAEAASPALRLHNQLQMACAGYGAADVLEATVANLATVIAVIAADREQASRLIACAGKDLEAAVDSSWNEMRASRASWLSGGSA